MNEIVIANNRYCQLKTEDKDITSKVKKLLSFKQVGVEYTAAYQNGWNGVSYLLNAKNQFPLGLLPKVQSFLSQSNIQVNIIDNRSIPIINKSLDISQRLVELKLDPRDYQIEALARSLENKKGIIRVCTGGGKTLVAALITASINKPTIIYVVGIDLLKQFHDLFSSIFEEKIGYIGNGICDIARINIASIWTIGRALELKKSILLDDEDNEKEDFNISDKLKIIKMLQNTNLHILDECHVSTTDTISAIYKAIDPEHILGMSGTPYRDDNSDLLINGILGEQIINIPASRLIKAGHLVKPIIKFISVPKIPVDGRTYHEVYREYVVENDVRNNMILAQTQNLVNKGYQTLVLFKTINHGKTLFKMFKENNIKCEMLYGKNKLEERNAVKEQIEKKEINVILASSIYDIGVDIPCLSGLVLTGSGKSSIRALQRIGRIIRKYPGKRIAAVVDFYDQCRYLSKHSKIRYNIYKSEEGFEIIGSDWVKQQLEK